MVSRRLSVPRRLRRARVAVGAAFFVHGAIATSWATRIPSVKANLELGEAGLGFALLGPALGALVTMPLGGAVTARRGSRAVTRTMLVTKATAVMLPVLAPSLPLLFAALVVYGASGGVMDVAMNAQGVAVERRYERPILSGLHALWSLGGVTGALAASAAADAGLGAVTHLALVSGVVIVGGLIATNSLLPAGADRSLEGPKFARPTGVLALIGAIAFCAMLAEGAALDWSAVYVSESLGGSQTLAAVAVASFSLGMASGRLVGDRLTARLGHAVFVRGAAVVALVGLLAACSAAHPLQGVLGFGIMGVGLASIVPVTFSRAGNASWITGAPGIATVATMGYTAFLVGPSLVGGTAEITSLRIALGAVGCLLALVPFLAGRMESESPA